MIPIYPDPSVPPNEVHVMQDNKLVARIINVASAELKEDNAKLHTELDDLCALVTALRARLAELVCERDEWMTKYYALAQERKQARRSTQGSHGL